MIQVFLMSFSFKINKRNRGIKSFLSVQYVDSVYSRKSFLFQLKDYKKRKHP